jgi:hypothetical protein
VIRTVDQAIRFADRLAVADQEFRTWSESADAADFLADEPLQAAIMRVRVAESSYRALASEAEATPDGGVVLHPPRANSVRVELMDALRAVTVAARAELDLPPVGGWALPMHGPEVTQPWRSIRRTQSAPDSGLASRRRRFCAT